MQKIDDCKEIRLALTRAGIATRPEKCLQTFRLVVTAQHIYHSYHYTIFLSHCPRRASFGPLAALSLTRARLMALNPPEQHVRLTRITTPESLREWAPNQKQKTPTLELR
jgi:hypothetical protein